MPNTWEPTLSHRLFGLLLGSAVLTGLTFGVRFLYDTSYLVAAIAVVIGAAVIIAVIAIFCAKLVSRKDQTLQMKLSTLFLPFIPIAIYLTLFSRLLEVRRQESPPDAPPYPPFAMFGGIEVAFAFFAITTVILLWFGEAIVWLAIRTYRAWRARRDS